MNRYDPDHAPSPEEWLGLDEQHRISLAEEYHLAKRIRLPNVKAHAIFHAIVENQIAENFEPAVRAVARLAAQGLSRHDAIHAIGSVLAGHVNDLAKTGREESLVGYSAAVERLTAKGWLSGKDELAV